MDAERPSADFITFKRIVDVVMCIFLMPALIVFGAILVVVNPRFNRGPLMYRQQRMGQNCMPFTALKFRTMLPVTEIARAEHDPVETDRITPLGQFLRKSRIDELPQIINVLKGEMSLIGPRPDYFPHAQKYLETIPGYRARHVVLPGISGLAQTEIGYVQCREGIQNKVRADLYYINNASVRLDVWVFWRTLVTIFGRKGV